jgi:hypothetical protein
MNSQLAAGLVGLSLVRADGAFTVDVLPASLVGRRMALPVIPSLQIAMSSARAEEGGLAYGIVNSGYQVGSTLGLAAMTALAASHSADQLGNVAALTDGSGAAFLGAVGIAINPHMLVSPLIRDAANRGCAEPRDRRTPGWRVGGDHATASGLVRAARALRGER